MILTSQQVLWSLSVFLPRAFPYGTSPVPSPPSLSWFFSSLVLQRLDACIVQDAHFGERLSVWDYLTFSHDEVEHHRSEIVPFLSAHTGLCEFPVATG